MRKFLSWSIWHKLWISLVAAAKNHPSSKMSPNKRHCLKSLIYLNLFSSVLWHFRASFTDLNQNTTKYLSWADSCNIAKVIMMLKWRLYVKANGTGSGGRVYMGFASSPLTLVRMQVSILASVSFLFLTEGLRIKNKNKNSVYLVSMRF